MENKLSALATAYDLEPVQPAKAARPIQEAEPVPQPPAAPEPDLRLVIEQDGASGGFVYKTVDRRTGEVVLQLPREEILKLREAGAYSAGDVIATQA